MARLHVKIILNYSSDFICAQDGSRTHTPLRAPAPQAGLSTNSNTCAKSANIVEHSLYSSSIKELRDIKFK